MISLQQYLKEEKFYKTVVEDGTDIIFIVDYDANILYHNPSVEQTIGYKNLIGKNFLEFINPDTQPILKKNFEISRKKAYNSNVEFQFRSKNGDYKHLEFNSINLRHKDEIEALILDCRDISERKKDQENLMRAQKAKEQFLANMSHEIRTPINGIVGMVNLLGGTVESPDQIKYLDAIKHSADNLKVIINDILDFSIIESGQLKFEKIGFDIDYQIKHIIESFRYQAEEKGLFIKYLYDDNQRRILLGDPVRLNQILINLISNAVKFTHTGGITIKLKFEQIDEHHVEAFFSITDTGIGIPTNQQKAIFDTFKQADESITRKFGGTGLGLTICKQLVELQNGTISAESIENEGTTFLFSIPYEIGRTSDLIYQDSTHKERDQSGKKRNLKGMKVLLVEDNDINRLYAANVLKKWNCYYDEAENGLIALEKLRKKDYDIILMDVQMPILDGLEASRNIRASFPEPKNKTPIVAFTANAIKGDRDKCLAVGMDEYISKPFLPGELYDVLAKFYTNPESVAQQQKLTDLTYLRSVSDNDEQFVKEMVVSFIEKTPLLLEDLVSAANQENWAQVGALAHKLKPNLVFMGIESLKHLVLDIELSGKDQQHLDILANKVHTLNSRCLEAIAELKTNKLIEK